METPRQYAKRKISEMQKGNARIYITNMLRLCYLQSDKDFYASALKELDSITQS